MRHLLLLSLLFLGCDLENTDNGSDSLVVDKPMASERLIDPINEDISLYEKYNCSRVEWPSDSSTPWNCNQIVCSSLYVIGYYDLSEGDSDYECAMDLAKCYDNHCTPNTRPSQSEADEIEYCATQLCS